MFMVSEKYNSKGLYSLDFVYDLRYLSCGENDSKTSDRERPIFRYNLKKIQYINIKFNGLM